MYVVIYLISMNLLLLLISMRKGYARMKRNFRENIGQIGAKIYALLRFIVLGTNMIKLLL